MERFILDLVDMLATVVFSAYVVFAFVPSNLFAHRVRSRFAVRVLLCLTVLLAVSSAYLYKNYKIEAMSPVEYMEYRILKEGEYSIYNPMEDAVYILPAEVDEFPIDIKVNYAGVQTETVTINSYDEMPVTWVDIWEAYALYEEGQAPVDAMPILTSGTLLRDKNDLDTQTFTLFDKNTGISNGVYAIGVPKEVDTWSVYDLWRELVINICVFLGIVIAISSTCAIKVLRERRYGR